ncbi:MFS transporter [Sphingobium boeckii]|uniref:AAHS family 4-hydroxybenzoate transporter-like MFS transporter n=1 Tax=Sphingobium boeckii TaxID=1082345 RepID=A0A7W9AFU2_9SPHN|nr:MFS transporter [Sphingobium boeckii]MBB5684808.1 AAHS family 4-hydroxybenzoate transporter-like MFS transporter [Sphingobium boeckii]
MMSASSTIPPPASVSQDLDELLDRSRMSFGHWIAASMFFLIMMADGYDLYVMVQLLPTIAKSFAVSTAVLTTAYATQTLGQAVGALGISPIADRFGRKPLLIICMILLGIATFAGSFSVTAEQFTITRFIAGAFGGAIMPITVSLAADIAPTKWRSNFIGITYAGIGIGGMLAVVAVSLLLDSQGWHRLFYIGSFLPVIIAVLFALFGIESLRHRARKNGGDLRIVKDLKRIGIPTLPGAHFATVSGASKDKAISLIEIFRGKYAVVTVLLTMAAMCTLTAATLFSMVPTFYHEIEGIPLAQVVAPLAIFQVIALPLSFLYGVIMDKIGRFRVIWFYASAAPIALICLAYTKFGDWKFTAVFLLCGFFINASLQSLSIVVPTLYPSTMRAAALGWKAGSGRLASMTAPLLAGVILATKASIVTALATLCVPMVVLALVIPALMRAVRKADETRG